LLGTWISDGRAGAGASDDDKPIEQVARMFDELAPVYDQVALRSSSQSHGTLSNCSLRFRVNVSSTSVAGAARADVS
jgi:hypothetical protein